MKMISSIKERRSKNKKLKKLKKLKDQEIFCTSFISWNNIWPEMRGTTVCCWKEKKRRSKLEKQRKKQKVNKIKY